MLFELLINPASDEAAKELEIVLTMSCSGAQQNCGIQSFWGVIDAVGDQFRRCSSGFCTTAYGAPG
jgi:hypothetical protein